MKPLKSVEQIGSDIGVILRLDTDLPIEGDKVLDNSRLLKSISTIKLLLRKNNKIVVVGHRGRPEGMDKSLSLRIVYAELMALLERDGENLVENIFVEDIKNKNEVEKALKDNQIIFIENLRFWKEEELGNTKLFDNLKKYCLAFVNDAFAVAHRKSASVLLFKEMLAFYGLSFIEEANKICQVFDNLERPLTIILGGAKEDKLKYLEELSHKADYVLIGGKLPKIIEKNSPLRQNKKIKIAELKNDGLDLSNKDILEFKKIISKSKVIIWAGAMGFYESSENRKGTEEIAKEISKNSGYKIIAGGDTAASIVELKLGDKINFICSGGGVMLEFLSNGTLPAWAEE